MNKLSVYTNAALRCPAVYIMLLYGRWRTWQSTLLNVNVLSICSGTGQSLFTYVGIMLIIPALAEAETEADPNGSDACKPNASLLKK